MGDEFARVRSQIFWLAVIALALTAIVSGYVSGRATAPPALALRARASPPPAVHAVLRDPSDSAADDIFSADDVVVDRSPAVTARWLEPALSVVVGLCGGSAPIDAQFMRLNVPIAFDIDPNAGEAVEVARLAHESGDVVLLHVGTAPSQSQLARLRARFGDFDGIASRTSERFVQALNGTGLLFFDERGDADAAEFTGAGIPIVQRDETVDDRTARSYIRFMLERAVQRSQHAGRLVIFMRPRAHSLEALTALVSARSAQLVPLTQHE